MALVELLMAAVNLHAFLSSSLTRCMCLHFFSLSCGQYFTFMFKFLIWDLCYRFSSIHFNVKERRWCWRPKPTIFQSFSQYFLIFFSLSVALSPKFIASYLSSKCVSDLLCPLSFLTGLATADWSIRRVVLSYLNALNLHWPQKILQLSSPTPMSFSFLSFLSFFGFFCWVHRLTYKLPIQCLMQPNDRGQEVKTMSLAAAVKQRKE